MAEAAVEKQADALVFELRRRLAVGEINAEEFKLAKKFLAEELAARSDTPSRAKKSRFWKIVFYSCMTFIGLLFFLGAFIPHDPAGRDARSFVTSDLPEGDGISFYRSLHKEDWPYPPFEEGVVRCNLVDMGTRVRPLVTIELGGTAYGLNGAALDAGYPDPRRFVPVDEYGIFKGRTPSLIASLISIGRANCH